MTDIQAIAFEYPNNLKEEKLEESINGIKRRKGIDIKIRRIIDDPGQVADLCVTPEGIVAANYYADSGRFYFKSIEAYPWAGITADFVPDTGAFNLLPLIEQGTVLEWETNRSVLFSRIAKKIMANHAQGLLLFLGLAVLVFILAPILIAGLIHAPPALILVTFGLGAVISNTSHLSTESKVEIDILRVEAAVRDFRFKTCFANAAMLIYFLRALGEKAELIGMFRKAEDIPFQYLVLTEKWGERDIAPYDDECDTYERTDEVNSREYDRGLAYLKDGGYLFRADSLIKERDFSKQVEIRGIEEGRYGEVSQRSIKWQDIAKHRESLARIIARQYGKVPFFVHVGAVYNENNEGDIFRLDMEAAEIYLGNIKNYLESAAGVVFILGANFEKLRDVKTRAIIIDIPSVAGEPRPCVDNTCSWKPVINMLRELQVKFLSPFGGEKARFLDDGTILEDIGPGLGCVGGALFLLKDSFDITVFPRLCFGAFSNKHLANINVPLDKGAYAQIQPRAEGLFSVVIPSTIMGFPFWLVVGVGVLVVAGLIFAVVAAARKTKANPQQGSGKAKTQLPFEDMLMQHSLIKELARATGESEKRITQDFIRGGLIEKDLSGTGIPLKTALGIIINAHYKIVHTNAEYNFVEITFLVGENTYRSIFIRSTKDILFWSATKGLDSPVHHGPAIDSRLRNALSDGRTIPDQRYIRDTKVASGYTFIGLLGFLSFVATLSILGCALAAPGIKEYPLADKPYLPFSRASPSAFAIAPHLAVLSFSAVLWLVIGVAIITMVGIIGVLILQLSILRERFAKLSQKSQDNTKQPQTPGKVVAGKPVEIVPAMPTVRIKNRSLSLDGIKRTTLDLDSEDLFEMPGFEKIRNKRAAHRQKELKKFEQEIAKAQKKSRKRGSGDGSGQNLIALLGLVGIGVTLFHLVGGIGVLGACALGAVVSVNGNRDNGGDFMKSPQRIRFLNYMPRFLLVVVLFVTALFNSGCTSYSEARFAKGLAYCWLPVRMQNYKNPDNEVRKKIAEVYIKNHYDFDSNAVLVPDEFCRGFDITREDFLRAYQRLLSVSDFKLAIHSARVLARMGDPSGKDILVKGLNGDYKIGDQDPDAKTITLISCNAAFSLAQLNDPLATSFLLQVLKDAKNSPELKRCAAISYLMSLEGEEVVDALVTAAHDQNDEVRTYAIAALRNFKGQRIFETLRNALNDNNVSVVNQAITALGILQDKQAAPYLEGALKKGIDAERKIRILVALSQIESENLFELAVREKNDPDPSVRQVVMLVICQVDHPRVTQILKEGLADSEPLVRIGAIKALSAKQDEDLKISNLIIEQLAKEQDNNVRIYCLDALGVSEQLVVKEAVKSFLSGKDLTLKQAAILALAQNLDKEKMGWIADMLDDKSAEIRQTAVAVLGGRVGENPWLFDRINGKISDSSAGVSSCAAILLSQHIDTYPQLQEPLGKILSKGDLNTRLGILSGFAQANSAIGAQMVEPLLKDPVWEIRFGALQVMGRNQITPAAVEPIKKMAQTDVSPYVRGIALFNLSMVNSPDCLGVLTTGLKDNNFMVRQAAVAGLAGRITKQPNLVENIKPLLNDAHWQVRQAAVLGFADGVVKQPNLLEHIKPLLNDNHWQVRQAAVEVAGRVKSPQIPEMLIPKLSDQSAIVRQATVENLGRVTGKEVVRPLLLSFKDDSPVVREAAKFVLASKIVDYPSARVVPGAFVN
ncbi:MAG: HEAT repeat domain-containing protein [Candidatus Omnitrophica bacterium]|nr:HEAT repeat domain-containing protein [Candidatus Omnitrophota bacterium]